MFAEGSNGSVELFQNHVVIRRKGFANVLTQGVQGDKSILLNSITAIQFLKPRGVLGGLIQFTILGGREFGGGMMEATKDENAIIFTKAQEPMFLSLKQIIEDRIASVNDVMEVSRHSGATELVELAELVDKGFLTRSEFDARKAIILGSAFRDDEVKSAIKLQHVSSSSSHNQWGISETPASLAPDFNTASSKSQKLEYQSRRYSNWKGGLTLGFPLVILYGIFMSIVSGSKEPPYKEAAAKSSGTYWRQVGQLDSVKNLERSEFKFVVISKRSAGLIVYTPSIK